MAVEIIMPKMGMAMKEGTVAIWHKKVGDTVKKGELIASIQSEKIEAEIEAPADGTMIDISVSEGKGVPPGAVIGYIGNKNEDVPSQPDLSTQATEQQEIAATVEIDKKPKKTTKQASNGKIKISPVARKMAEAAGLPIEHIHGTGPQGRITKEDVTEALAQKDAAKGEMKATAVEASKQLKVEGMRKVIADRMYENIQHTAQLTLNSKADVTELQALQKKLSSIAEKNHSNKLTLTDFIAKAVVLSLQKHQQMNSAYVDEHIQQFAHIHLGIAVALENGLVVPVIKHAEQDSLLHISKQIKLLAQKARQGTLESEEMAGSTFTISNLGAYGVEHFTPILNPPETGILGVGAIEVRPAFIGENIEKRSYLPLSLTFDHRVLDGAPAAAFLKTVVQLLEEPYALLL